MEENTAAQIDEYQPIHLALLPTQKKEHLLPEVQKYNEKE
jgi:hypothetical protein